jgi:glycerate dehydrogenase
MNIVFLDEKTMGGVPNLTLLAKLGNYTSYPITLHDERKTRISNADIVVACKVMIDREIIDSCPSLKMICVAATGTNNVDVEYAQAKGIVVKNVAGYSTESVAQSTIGITLALVNKTAYYDAYVKSGGYAASDMFTHYGPGYFELRGKNLGIIGLGSIGRRVAEIFEVFGMKIHYHSVSGKNTEGGYQHLPLNELLAISDIVSIHCSLTDKSRNIINLENIQLMKSSAILINMARGGIVNENDVVKALNNDVIAGFGTDVYEKEPMDKESPFLRVKNPDRLVLAPHMAWTSIEARTLLIEKIVENIISFKP